MRIDQLLQAAQCGRPLARGGVFAVAAFGTILVTQVAVGLIASALGLGPWVSILSFLAAIVVTWLFTHFVDRRSFLSIGLWSRNLINHWLRGFIWGLVMFGIVVLLLAVFGVVGVAGAVSGAGISTALLGLGFFLIQGPAEEIVNRGYLLPTLAVGSSVSAAIVGTASYFSVTHGLNPNITSLAVINLFLAGIFLGLYFTIEGELWGVFGWHTAWNWAQGPLLGLPVSGLDGTRPLIDLEATGRAWLTGGAFGPEGGLAATVVLLAGCLLLVWRYQRDLRRDRARARRDWHTVTIPPPSE